MKIIQVGNGNVAPMHRKCFTECGAKVIAVIDINPAKRQRATEEDLPAFPDIASLPPELMEGVDLWDICVPDETHVPMMEEILERGFKKILVEKPICVPSQTTRLKNLLAKFPEAQICVEETYASSAVVKIIRQESEKCGGMKHPKILIEQSKNRMQDIINGRFTDKELGVFALEVPHSLTIIAATGDKRLPLIIKEVSLKDMQLPSGEILPRQGKGLISYLTEDGCRAIICSAMNGEVLYPMSEINAPPNIPLGSPVRYRILVLEEEKNKIIGQFEPIPGFPRFRGRVLIYRERILVDVIWVEDKPMNQHIARAIRYFKGEEKNPAPPLEALSLVSFLNEALERLEP